MEAMMVPVKLPQPPRITVITSYISSSMRDIFAYALLVIVLFVRPSGLMGKATEDKA